MVSTTKKSTEASTDRWFARNCATSDEHRREELAAREGGIFLQTWSRGGRFVKNSTLAKATNFAVPVTLTYRETS